MFAGAVLGFSLVLQVSVMPGTLDPDPIETPARLSEQEKTEMMVPLVQRATDCVSRTVASDPRLGKADFGDLIAESFATCTAPVRAMIDTYDRVFGIGSGEQYFMGPYLDGLPAAVSLYVAKQNH